MLSLCSSIVVAFSSGHLSKLAVLGRLCLRRARKLAVLGRQCSLYGICECVFFVTSETFVATTCNRGEDVLISMFSTALPDLRTAWMPCPQHGPSTSVPSLLPRLRTLQDAGRRCAFGLCCARHERCGPVRHVLVHHHFDEALPLPRVG